MVRLPWIAKWRTPLPTITMLTNDTTAHKMRNPSLRTKTTRISIWLMLAITAMSLEVK